jgi:hypothetical protein
MNRVITGSCLAAVFAVGLAAQTNPPQSTPPQTTPPQTSPQSPRQQPMQESKDAAKALTVTGCLKAGDTPDSFILSDLKWGNKDKDASAVGTSGTAPAALASAKQLKLKSGSSSPKLSEHVGHTVEVTGTPESGSAGAYPSDPAKSDPSKPSSSASSSSAATIEVRSIKMVSTSCSGQ